MDGISARAGKDQSVVRELCWDIAEKFTVTKTVFALTQSRLTTCDTRSHNDEYLHCLIIMDHIKSNEILSLDIPPVEELYR